MPDRDNTYSTIQIRKISQCHSSYGKKTRLASPKLDRCKDLNKGYDMFMIASRQNKVWGFSRLDADYMYNSFCDSKKVNNFRFKQWKKESKRFYKEAY